MSPRKSFECSCPQQMLLQVESVKCCLWQCGDPWRIRAGDDFSPGVDLTVGPWVASGPRQNPQPWLVILLGLPLGTVRTGGESIAEGHPHGDPHTLHSKYTLFSILLHKEQYMVFRPRPSPQAAACLPQRIGVGVLLLALSLCSASGPGLWMGQTEKNMYLNTT